MTNLDITSCYVGDSQVDKIYLGTDILWQKQSPVPPDLPYSAQPFTIQVVDTTSGDSINFFKIVPTATTQSAATNAPNKTLYYTINKPFTDISTWTYYDNPWKSNGQYVVHELHSNESITGLSSGDTVRFYTFVENRGNQDYPDLEWECGPFGASGQTSLTAPPNNVPTNSFGHSTVGCVVYGNIMSLITGMWFKYIEGDAWPITPVTNFYELGWTSYDRTSRNIFLGLFCTSGASTNKMNLYDAQNLVLPQDVKPGCYFRLFGRTEIEHSPELPATTLAYNCYTYMYAGCKQITDSPVLPAGYLTGQTNGCYASMFYGCSNLTGVTCLAISRTSPSYTSTWLSGVAATGTFYKNSNATFWGSGTTDIPTGWTVQNYISS